MALSAQADSPGLASSGQIVKLVVATSLGNALEWFDISVYAYFAVYLSKAFFPASDPTTSLLLTFGTFGLRFWRVRSVACCSAPTPTGTAARPRCWFRSR
jgi:MHS family proline/betaine transporter-like MFS transporter